MLNLGYIRISSPILNYDWIVYVLTGGADTNAGKP